MNTREFAAQVSTLACLAEPVRRELYLYVAAQPGPVSRDQACQGVGVARHTAKFHLDKLVEEGLLDTTFKRLSGRRGPGAGRPAKLYQRSNRHVSVTLPERHYDLAANLLAQAIQDSVQSGAPVVASLHSAAAEFGAAVGEQVRREAADLAGPDQLLAATCAALTAHGYEPRRHGETIAMANCPFDTLARQHTKLICGMNLALLDAVADQVGDALLNARLQPSAERCCVLLDTGPGAGTATSAP